MDVLPGWGSNRITWIGLVLVRHARVEMDAGGDKTGLDYLEK